MKKSLSPIDIVCWFMFLMFAIVASFELSNVYTPSTAHAARTGAIIGFAWFAFMAILFAVVPVLRIVRQARVALTSRTRTKLSFSA